MIYEQILAEQQRLEKQIQSLESYLNSLPEGNVCCTRNGTHYRTISGNYVRSKSESLIDMALHLNKIPFHYEAALSLGNTTFYPDFTIRHPHTGAIYYWEHFGMMDNPDYSNIGDKKLRLI